MIMLILGTSERNKLAREWPSTSLVQGRIVLLLTLQKMFIETMFLCLI